MISITEIIFQNHNPRMDAGDGTQILTPSQQALCQVSRLSVPFVKHC